VPFRQLLLVVGCWLLVVGCWLLVVGCWLLLVVVGGVGVGGMFLVADARLAFLLLVSSINKAKHHSR